MVYYFAFGSNLWLEQMAKRCPDSRYVGRAMLPDFKWQINQRGFANVVPSAGSCVHGLVYKINSVDEAQLDRNEGVHSGAYEKRYLDVTLYEAPDVLRVHARDVMGLLDRIRNIDPLRREKRPVIKEDVLVYLSTRFVTPDRPRPEYVNRINDGIRDAVQLGVSSAYFQNAVRSFIPLPPLPPPPPPPPIARSRPSSRPPVHPTVHSSSARPGEDPARRLRRSPNMTDRSAPRLTNRHNFKRAAADQDQRTTVGFAPPDGLHYCSHLHL